MLVFLILKNCPQGYEALIVVLLILFYSAVCFALQHSLLVAFALVVKLFALAHAKLHFYLAFGKIERKGDEGVAVFIAKHHQLQNFSFVHQKLALAQRIAVEDIALFIGTDMYAFRKELAVFNVAIAVF